MRATGDPPQNENAPLTAFAVGDREQDFLAVTAFQPTAPQVGNVFALFFDGLDPENPGAGEVIVIRDGRFEVPIGTGAAAQGSVRPARIPQLSRLRASQVSAGKP